MHDTEPPSRLAISHPIHFRNLDRSRIPLGFLDLINPALYVPSHVHLRLQRIDFRARDGGTRISLSDAQAFSNHSLGGRSGRPEPPNSRSGNFHATALRTMDDGKALRDVIVSGSTEVHKDTMSIGKAHSGPLEYPPTYPSRVHLTSSIETVELVPYFSLPVPSLHHLPQFLSVDIPPI